MQAVIKSGSSQYLVVPGQELLIDRIPDAKSPLVFSEVLLFADDKQTLVGTPTVSGYSVKAEIVSEVKGDKVRVFKYKSKSKYRKHTGFRAQLLKIKVLSIDFPGSEKVEKTETPKAVEKTEAKPKTAKPAVKKTTKTSSKK